MEHDVEKIRFTLRKKEILRKKKLIKELFEHGSSFFLHPFKIFYLSSPELKNNQFLFSVSKKYFKNSTDRNLIKRRIRESLRLNKHSLLLGQNNIYYCIAIVYISKDIMAFNEIEHKLIEALGRLNNIEEN